MELLMDGLKLLVIGMGWVFLFLTLMIGVIALVSKLVAPYAHIFEPPRPVAETGKSTVPAKEDSAMAAAAAAAVELHRNRG